MICLYMYTQCSISKLGGTYILGHNSCIKPYYSKQVLFGTIDYFEISDLRGSQSEILNSV